MARDKDTGIVKPAAKVVDEQTKKIGAASSVAAAKAASAKAAEQAALLAAEEALMADENKYYTKVLASGKTQAQIDALRNAYDTAELINKTSTTKTSTVDRITGKVVTTNRVPVTKINEDIPVDVPVNVTLVSTETDDFGNVIGFYSDGTQKTLIASGNKYKSTVDVDAYTLLESTFKDYGLEDLVPEIKKFMEAGLGSNQAALELKKTTAYITRFKGNETRRAAGLNVLSEGAYLELENSYNETLRAYGQQGFFGADRKASQAKMAEIIGNDISAIEFKDRVDAVVTRFNNSDPSVKSTLKAFYNIGDQDLIAYFLSPKENLPKLQEKVTSAEIGSEALKQNLITDVTSASALARMGITKAQAREGYETISGVLPTASKLGQIYGEEGINYTQKTAEEEVFGQLESAKRKRLRLAEKEVGSFSGTSGLALGALGSGKSSAF